MGEEGYEPWDLLGPIEVQTPDYEEYGWTEVEVSEVAAADEEAALITACIMAEIISLQLIARGA